MASKTKIVVFRMRELIYTGIFAALGIILIVLLILMFRPQKSPASVPQPTESQDSTSTTTSRYIPGVYTTSITRKDSTMDVEVTVDENHINSIRFVNLSESTTAMYPLMQSALDELAKQICEKQTTEGITYSKESKYTSLMLLDAVEHALDAATVK